MNLLALLDQQQELVRSLLRGQEVEPDHLALLAAPLPPLDSPTAALDRAELLRLQERADELERLLAERMSALRAVRARAEVPERPARFLDTSL